MGDDRGAFQRLDQNIAAGLREYREAGGLSQEELAQRMTGRGFGFSQATIWKIEAGQRPVKLSEAAALADALGILSLSFLLDDPESSRHQARLQWQNHKALEAYQALKAAAAAYLEAQLELVLTARAARDAGVGAGLVEMRTSWLDIPAERAVIEARIESERHEDAAIAVDEAVDQVLQALRDRGYDARLRPEDVEVEGGGPPPARTPT
jgi:transcriptional regulator with XRE-family HTH domain